MYSNNYNVFCNWVRYCIYSDTFPPFRSSWILTRGLSTDLRLLLRGSGFKVNPHPPPILSPTLPPLSSPPTIPPLLPPFPFLSTSLIITINVPIVFMARYVMVLRGATSLRGALEEVGPENQDFLGSNMATSEAGAILAQKNRDFMYTRFCILNAVFCILEKNMYIAL
jgi:hypothetical protein